MEIRRDILLVYLKENPLICEEIEAKVRDLFKLDGAEEAEEEAKDAPEVLDAEE